MINRISSLTSLFKDSLKLIVNYFLNKTLLIILHSLILTLCSFNKLSVMI